MTAEFIIRLILRQLPVALLAWKGKCAAKEQVTHTCINWHGKRPVYDCFEIGFADVLSLDHVGLDPSRIAARW